MRVLVNGVRLFFDVDGAGLVPDGAAMKKFPSESAFLSSSEPGWAATIDKFGAVSEIRIPASAAGHNVKLSARSR